MAARLTCSQDVSHHPGEPEAAAIAGIDLATQKPHELFVGSRGDEDSLLPGSSALEYGCELL